MRIGWLTNGTSCEYAMQDALKVWLQQKELKFIDEYRIPEAKRIPDFLVVRPGKGLINIEAKCNDLDCLCRQLKDNSVFSDYSFAYIPDYCLTPMWFIERLAATGFGLIVYNYKDKTITEVLEAHQNKNVDKDLKKTIIARIDRELAQRKSRQVIDTQQKLQTF